MPCHLKIGTCLHQLKCVLDCRLASLNQKYKETSLSCLVIMLTLCEQESCSHDLRTKQEATEYYVLTISATAWLVFRTRLARTVLLISECTQDISAKSRAFHASK